MDQDFENDPTPQVLVGDLNTSTITAWGEDNLESNNPEKKVQDKLNECFEDLFLKDHDKITGQRSSGAPVYLQKDNEKMNSKNLDEPSGTWYVGPFAEPRGFTGKSLQKHKEKDRKKYDYKTEKNPNVKTEESVSWGTPRWRNSQTANTARFDYILIPKRQKQLLDGNVEIRRVLVPKEAHSAPTDHLPVDAKIWLKN